MAMQPVSARARACVPAALLFTTLAGAAAAADAPRGNRPGKEVVDAVCAACHLTGKDGAPRIGDNAAWAQRAAQGLTALTGHAIRGIRKMPAHGGNVGVSNAELERAIVYMVNNSGGNWIEPAMAESTAMRSTDGVVQGQCAKCHEPGTNGAPKIGDRAAWTARLAKGLDALTASAVHGHGPMPARGGMPDLDRDEIRSAIVYMFNYGLPPAPPPPPEERVDPYHKQVADLDIYFGVIRAEALRAQVAADKTRHQEHAIPSGKGYYHLNISLADRKSRRPVHDAKVSMRVSDGYSGETKDLGPMAANNAVSYGNFFRFMSGNAYNITTEIRRPGVASPVVATFEFRAP